MKALHKENPKKSPIAKIYGFSQRVQDIEYLNRKKKNTKHVAFVILKHPLDRFIHAFNYIRHGGYYGLSPENPIIKYNSTDSLIKDLRSRQLSAYQALYCDVSMKFCGITMGKPNTDSTKKIDFIQNVNEFNLENHTTVEFRPQSWYV